MPSLRDSRFGGHGGRGLRFRWPACVAVVASLAIAVPAAALVPEGVAAPEGPAPTEPGAAPEFGAPPSPPPEAAPTRATFLSSTSEGWNVAVDGADVCASPCTVALYPTQFVTLGSQELRPVLLDVGRLPAGDFLVTGKPFASGMYAGGIVATTLGGMALAIGITFTAVGLAKDRGGMTTAGLITGGVGALALPGGIYLMMKALPEFTVNGTPPYGAAVAARF